MVSLYKNNKALGNTSKNSQDTKAHKILIGDIKDEYRSFLG